MPKFCAVYGCCNRSNREKDKGYFRVPKVVYHNGEKYRKLTEKRRDTWINNLRLTRETAGVNARVCGDHFVQGCPSTPSNVHSQDWAPTVNLGYQLSKTPTEESLQVEETLKAREAFCSEQTETSGDPGEGSLIPEPKYLKDAECQTDLCVADLSRMEDSLNDFTSELSDLRKKLLDTEFNLKTFENNDDKTKFYTGLPNFLVLMQVFQLCEPFITLTTSSALSKFEQFIMVLIRLRLNLQYQDLAFRFKVSPATVCQIWFKVIHILHKRLEFIVRWPERDILHATMPLSFQRAFGCNVAVILDCFEVFIEKPKNPLAKAQTWSNYKHHNTIKFLIGITPQGYVTFISRAWGGRVSDKQITEDCGILHNLLPGDVVLANRGFTIQDSVGFYCASLKIPSFTRGKIHLSPYEVEETGKLASIRIHMERVIGLVRQKYLILQSRAMSSEHMAVESADSLSLIDKIAVICCALTNLLDSVVPLE